MAGPVITAGLAAAEVASVEANPTLTRAQKNEAYTANAGGLAGSFAGMKLGAMAGSAVAPGIGTIIGGILGGMGGRFAGTEAGRWVGKSLWGPSSETLNAAKELSVKDERVINFNAQRLVDGREMAQVVNKVNAEEATRK